MGFFLDAPIWMGRRIHKHALLRRRWCYIGTPRPRVLAMESTTLWIAIYVAAAVFGVGVGILGGCVAYQSLRKKGLAMWLSGALSVPAGFAFFTEAGSFCCRTY